MKKQQPQDSLKVKGMFRIHIGENGKIVGDSGWKKNTITDLGFRQYLVLSLGSLSGSKYVSHIAVANDQSSNGALAPSVTGLTSELDKRTTVSASSTVAGSRTIRFTGSFMSSLNTATSSAWIATSNATRTIQSIGLFNTSSGGTMFAGNTFSSSTIATNQSLFFTYDIQFA